MEGLLSTEPTPSSFFAFGHLIQFLLLKSKYQTQFVEKPEINRHNTQTKKTSATKGF